MRQLLHRVGPLAASLALAAAGTGCGTSTPPDNGTDPVDVAFASINDPSPALGLHLLPNCRLDDTRNLPHAAPDGGAPALVAGSSATISPTRDFVVVGNCMVPPEAKAIAAHIATVNSADIGFLMIGPANGPNGPLPPPLVATLNYVPNMVAADATTLALGDNGIRVFSNKSTHFVVDITGYYTEIPQPPIRVTPVGAITAGVQHTSTPDWNALDNVCGTVGTNDVPITFTNGEDHTPPLGTGSFDADLTDPAASANGAALDSQAFNSRKVGDITGMRYSSRQFTAVDSPYIEFAVDTTGGNTQDRTLYFFPANNPSQGAVVGGGIWQSWDPLDGDWNINGVSSSTVQYSDDFSSDTGDWAPNPNPPVDGVVAPGPGGTVQLMGNTYTKWGGFSDVWPAYGYTTSIDVFIDTTASGQWDFTSGINQNAAQSAMTGCDMSNGPGCYLADFVFNASVSAGTYNISASNQALVDPLANPACGSSPSATDCYTTITTSGWYTLEHNFHDSGSGHLEVTLTLKQQGGPVVQSWTMTTSYDLATLVGGNRYGWFVSPTVPDLLVDNEARTFTGGSGPGVATSPLSDYSNATILGVRAVMGCTGGGPYGHEGVDDFEMAFGGGPATIYDFERQ